MKSETYNAHAGLSRGYDLMLESLVILKEQGIITVEYVQQQLEILEELRSGMNGHIHNILQTRERDDQDHYGKMRETTARRMRGQQTIEGLPASDRIGK